MNFSSPAERLCISSQLEIANIFIVSVDVNSNVKFPFYFNYAAFPGGLSNGFDINYYCNKYELLFCYQ